MTFSSTPAAALALLSAHVAGDIILNRRSGQFLGQICVDDTPLSEAQKNWRDQLLQKSNLPPIDGGAHG